MLVFRDRVTLHICSRQDTYNEWRDRFIELAGSANVSDTLGAWRGERCAEVERDLTVTVWLDGRQDWCKVAGLLELAEQHHRADEQEATSIEYVADGIGPISLVVFDNDWCECRRHLRQAFHVESHSVTVDHAAWAAVL